MSLILEYVKKSRTFLLKTSSQNSLQINFIKSSGSVEVNLWLATTFSQYLDKSFVVLVSDRSFPD
jgi:hypothetical protein